VTEIYPARVRRGLKTVVAFHVGEPSGPSRTLAPVLRSLAANEGEVVIALPSRGGAAEELRDVGRIVITAHEPLTIPRSALAAGRLGARLHRDVRRFRRLLRDERPDLALVATTVLPAATAAAWLERVPTIVYATELYRQGAAGDRLRGRVGRALMRLSARLAATTVTSSRAVAEAIGRPERTVVAYPSIDGAVIEGDARAFRRRHAIPDGGPCIATLGNITRGRGQDVAIQALAMLRRDHPDVWLLIAGRPHPRPADRRFAGELLALAEELGVRDAVHLCGFAPAGDVFSVSDIVVNPARFAESFGRVAMEALLAGRPVVSSRVGGVPEVLEDGRHALLVPPDDPPALAAALRRLLDDPALGARLASAGRLHVAATYTTDRQLAAFSHAVERALRSRR
jgi:glycosyltransferase involved in cell wall biosynthesis